MNFPLTPLRRILLQALVSLVFTVLVVWHMEARGTFQWGYEVVVCTLIGTGVSVNLTIKSFSPDMFRKHLKTHLLRLLGSVLSLWVSYLLFEEVLFRNSTIQYSVIYQFIKPFLVIAVYFFVLKYLYRLDRVIFAVFITEALLGTDLIISFSADTMGELYYPASLLLVILFVFPVGVREKG
jgi:hypothetical protein